MKKKAKAQAKKAAGASAVLPTGDKNVTRHTRKPTYLAAIRNNFYTIAAVALVVAVGVAAYYIYNAVRRYLISKDILTLVNLVGPTSPTVGETLTCRLRFKKKNGKIITATSTVFQELEKNIVIEINSNNVSSRKIAVVREFDKKSGWITGKFSVRKSGTYEVKVKYHMFYLESENPFQFEVYPGSASPKFMDFATHNSNILCTTAGLLQHFKILAEDEYGNKCHDEDVALEKFDFQIYYMGNSFPVQHEFCYHQCNLAGGIEGSSNASMAESSMRICLKLRINQPGIYRCVLKFGEYEVRDRYGTPKLLVCVSSSEERELKALFSQMKVPGTLIYTSECEMSLIGDEDGLQHYYLGVSSAAVVFALHAIPLRLYPDVKFSINGRTKVAYQVSQTMDGETANMTFLIQDGVQESVRLEMPASPGRMFLIAFAHSQGFLRSKTRMTFQERRDSFKVKLFSYFFWFSSEKVLHLKRENVVESTIKYAPTHQDDWLLPFKIVYDNDTACAPLELSKKPVPSKQGVQEWINRLCEELFGLQGETASLFQKRPGSKLLHLVPSYISQRPLEIYRLAGQILAKAIVETLLRDMCTRLSEIRLTRSVLAFLLGVPITFKFLETDEPQYFHKILKILESDLSGSEYRFTTCASSTSETDIVNLIPNGSDIAVTNSNKEHYMNQLTYYRLIHAVEQEIAVFRIGFYDVIDKDKLNDFQELDLQKLISGGRNFQLDELKAHHRVVKEVESGFSQPIRKQSMDTKKLLEWFWIAVENMSEEEQSHLIFFATGSLSLPSCGFADLNPIFTISLTGTYNRPPRSNPKSNEIVLGNHNCFDSFEKSLLHAIKPELDKFLLATARVDALQLLDRHEENAVEEEDGDDDTENEGIEETEEISTGGGDSIVNWFKGLLLHY